MAPRSTSRSTSPDAAPDIVVGRVHAPHGLRGEVKVEPLTDRFQERFAPGSRLESAIGSVTVDAVRGTEAAPIVRFEGIEDRAAAEKLRGDLRVPRAEARREGEHLWADLIGREVVTPEGERLGEVRDVLRAGGADVLVVQGERELLLPMLASVVREVGERIVAVPQAEA